MFYLNILVKQNTRYLVGYGLIATTLIYLHRYLANKTMFIKDKSVIINIPRSRVKTVSPFNEEDNNNKKNTTKKLPRASGLIRKPSEFSIRKYSLPANKPLQVNVLKRNEYLLPYKIYAKKQVKLSRKKFLDIDIYDKYKINNIELRNRLHVEEPLDIVCAVKDFDESFFQYVNGRPLSKTIPLFKSLHRLFSIQLRMRQEIGYRHDCVLNIDINYRKELKIYSQSINRYMEHVKQFDDFISSDYQKSMVYLNQCDVLNNKLNAKIIELQNWATEKFTIVSRLISLDYLYGLQQKYGRFLYYLSPPIWRSKNREFARSIEIEAKGFDFGNSSEEDTFNVIFEKMQQECFSGLVKPVIFFTHPDDLFNIFNGIAKQQLHHFSHVTHLAPHAKILKESINTLKGYIEQDSAFVAHTIKHYKNLLEFCEQRCSYLELRFLKILNGFFYECIGAPDVLKFKLHIEFCYEKVFSEKPIHIDYAVMAKSLENMYMNYSQKLDELRSDKVELAMKKAEKAEYVKVKKANYAARELRLFKRMECALLRTHNLKAVIRLPSDFNVKRSKMRNVKSQCRKIKLNEIKHESTQQDITEAELQYLTLFTDWTNDDDPSKYLQSISYDKQSDKLKVI